MKVVAVNGSPRSQGNTYTAIRMMTDVLESQGIETEILQLGNQPISGCTVCGGCRKDPEGMCVLPGDHLRDYVKKMLEADGIILGSPVYYGAIAGGMKCFWIARSMRAPVSSDIRWDMRLPPCAGREELLLSSSSAAISTLQK